MKSLYDSLRDTTVCYWHDPKAGAGTLAALFVSNAALIGLAREIYFTSGISWITTTLIPILAFLLQGVAVLGSLARPGAKLPDEIFSLARLLGVVLLLALLTIAPGNFPPLRWFESLHSALATVWLATFIAVGLMVWRTWWLRRAQKPLLGEFVWPALYAWVVCSLFLYCVIGDDRTDNFLRDSQDRISALLGLEKSADPTDSSKEPPTPAPSASSGTPPAGGR